MKSPLDASGWFLMKTGENPVSFVARGLGY
jgi:hypothetical protein